MRRSPWIGFVAAAVATVAAARVWASDPQGVLVRPMRVVFDPPSPAAATRVRIEGVAALASNNGCYTDPGCGYLDYVCKAGEEALCREQWIELAATAAAGQCAALGSRRDAMGAIADNGRLRPFTEPPGTPDVYVASQGMG